MQRKDRTRTSVVFRGADYLSWTNTRCVTPTNSSLDLRITKIKDMDVVKSKINVN